MHADRFKRCAGEDRTASGESLAQAGSTGKMRNGGKAPSLQRRDFRDLLRGQQDEDERRGRREDEFGRAYATLRRQISRHVHPVDAKRASRGLPFYWLLLILSDQRLTLADSKPAQTLKANRVCVFNQKPD